MLPDMSTTRKPKTKTSASVPRSVLHPLVPVRWVPPASMKNIQKLCGGRWIDVLLHLPNRLLDRTQTTQISDAVLGERTTVLATVIKRSSMGGMRYRKPYIVRLEDESGSLEVIYFNYGGWIERAYPLNEEVIVNGSINEKNDKLQMMHPDVWPAGKGVENVAKLWPLYPLTAGVTQAHVTRVVADGLTLLEKHPAPEWLPKKMLEKFTWPNFADALNRLHHPEVEGDVLPTSAARTRLAFDEIYAHQLALTHVRRTTRKHPGIAHELNGEKRARFLEALPFDLTGDQAKVLDEIDDDMTAPTPMLRLVQGDVGSGKTVVAFLALLRAVEAGHQGALMAPTEILAQQHYESAQKLLSPLGVNVVLLTGKLTAAQKRKTKELIADGFADIVIGTHALAQEGMVFDRLSLAVVDEQHRFGVKQRLALTANGTAPDVLVMTATPIPRTLALTFYGDMDVSLIQEKPPGRTPVDTRVMSADKLPEIATGLERIIERGEQVYWVCPLVEESEVSDLSAATSRYEDLQQIYGDRVGLLTGKMKGTDKEAVMAAFKNKELDILVATTVIEVGVDVPNATTMVIEHAERFGLSALHQLRGRVGRGAKSSTCLLLFSGRLPEMASERLAAMRDSEDGFYLAEKDLELRGPGDVLGTRQSGQVMTRVADLHAHRDLIPLARELAEDVLGKPLSDAKKNALRALLTIYEKEDVERLLAAG